MSTKPQHQAPRTAAEINKRLEEIGAELAKGRIVPVRNARQLEAEQGRLQDEYREALERESVPRSAEYLREVREAEDRQARLADLFRTGPAR